MESLGVQYNELQQQINLYISCRGLKDLDTFSKSNPTCLVYEQFNGHWRKIDQTEIIKGNLNPDFEKVITLPYYFEKTQHLKFEIHDEKSNGDWKMMGSVETIMSSIMIAKKQVYTEALELNG